MSGSGETRDAILDALERLLARMPLRKITMEDIAAEAQLGRRTLYVYFGGRDEIMLASIDRVMGCVLSRLRALAADGMALADQRVHQMLVARIATRLDLVQPYAVNLNSVFEALRLPYLERRRSFAEAEAEIFRGVLDEGMTAGVFADGDAAALARTLLQATGSLLVYALSPAELTRPGDVAARAAAVADLLLDGLRRRSP